MNNSYEQAKAAQAAHDLIDVMMVRLAREGEKRQVDPRLAVLTLLDFCCGVLVQTHQIPTELILQIVERSVIAHQTGTYPLTH